MEMTSGIEESGGEVFPTFGQIWWDKNQRRRRKEKRKMKKRENERDEKKEKKKKRGREQTKRSLCG